MRALLKDSRALLLLAAVTLLLLSFAAPTFHVLRHGFDILAIVDITGSMNTRDYRIEGRPTSRLDYAKLSLRELIRRLPCPSKLALGIFTERQPFLLFEPIDVCEDFAPIDGAIEALNWRMAWEGDSHISAGLYRSIDMARTLGADLLFITDGQEAPPLPWSGGPPFDGRIGEVHGVIVGAGDYALSPIPKFDENGREIGFFGLDEVQHENRSGLPPPGAENREGYNPRNAPFGGGAASGSEHLSSVREDYLKELAAKTGLAYRHLERVDDLAEMIQTSVTPRPNAGAIDLRRWFAGAACMCLVAAYMAVPLIELLKRRRERQRFTHIKNMRRNA